jgi:hypothetical protein
MNRLRMILFTAALASLPSMSQTAGLPQVLVNGRLLNSQQLQALRATTGVAPQSGCFWYDSRSGLFGFCEHETAGVLPPGLNQLGMAAQNASRGDTGVYLNGRELNRIEKAFFERLFGPIPPSRWWLDGRTGDLGREGSQVASANLPAALARARRQPGDDNTYRWRDGHGTMATSDGNCTMMSVPGANVYATPGCE